MPSLNQYQKDICENCGTQTTKLNLARHKKSCSAGSLYCTQCPKFPTKSQIDLKYHIAKKHSAPKLDVTFKCKLCYQEFPRFYAFTLYINIETLNTACKSDQEQKMWMWNTSWEMLRIMARSCQHFLVDSELERARHKVINYAVEILNETIVNEKLDHFFNNLKCATKVNLAFGFILRNIEEGGFRYFYAHEKNTLLERSKLVCIHDDSAISKDFLNKIDVRVL